MPYKAVKNWVYVYKNGRWVRYKKHKTRVSARRHAAKLNRVVRHK